MRKNIPPNLYALDEEKVVIRTWESGGDEMPRQAQKAISEFDVIINGEKFTVYDNISTKAKIDYFYLKYKDRWHWTRDNIRNHIQYRT